MNEQEQLDSAWTKIQAGLQKEREGRALWIAGTLDLIQTLDSGRKHRSNTDFSSWLSEMGYGENRVSAIDRGALLNMAMDLEITREVLEQTTRRSWNYIWQLEVRPLLHKKMEGKSGTKIPIEQVTRYPETAIWVKARHEREAKLEQERLRQEQQEQERQEQLRQQALARREQRRKQHHKRAQEMAKEMGLEVSVEVHRPKPVGRMADDIREKYTELVEEVLCKMEELRQLNRYCDQMHQDLRHVLIGELRTIETWLDMLIREMLGDDGDLRKVKQFLCDEEIPLRVEDGS